MRLLVCAVAEYARIKRAGMDANPQVCAIIFTIQKLKTLRDTARMLPRGLMLTTKNRARKTWEHRIPRWRDRTSKELFLCGGASFFTPIVFLFVCIALT